jgi:glycine cleavage system H protein
MPNFPDDLRYSQDHVWVRVNAGTATIGITDYAQSQLGEIVLVELGSVGELVAADEPFGTVEAVKAVTEMYMPFAGTIEEINESLDDDPTVVNGDPYGEGWMAKVKPSSPNDVDALMSSKAYAAHTESSDD